MKVKLENFPQKTLTNVLPYRSSNTAAAVAFAAATAGTANPPAPPSRAMGRYYSAGAQELKSPMVAMQSKRLSILQTAATMRALNVVRHWVSKFPEVSGHIIGKEVF